jgi:hypothetical protein
MLSEKKTGKKKRRSLEEMHLFAVMLVPWKQSITVCDGKKGRRIQLGREV